MKLTPQLIADDALHLMHGVKEQSDVMRLMAEAIERKLTDPECPSLDVLFGFAVSGPSYARRTIKQHRDSILRQWRQFELPDLANSDAARVIAERLKRYEATRWRFSQGQRPEGAVEALAFDLLSAGEKLPGYEAIRRALSDR